MRIFLRLLLVSCFVLAGVARGFGGEPPTVTIEFKNEAAAAAYLRADSSPTPKIVPTVVSVQEVEDPPRTIKVLLRLNVNFGKSDGRASDTLVPVTAERDSTIRFESNEWKASSLSPKPIELTLTFADPIATDSMKASLWSNKFLKVTFERPGVVPDNLSRKHVRLTLVFPKVALEGYELFPTTSSFTKLEYKVPPKTGSGPISTSGLKVSPFDRFIKLYERVSDGVEQPAPKTARLRIQSTSGGSKFDALPQGGGMWSVECDDSLLEQKVKVIASDEGFVETSWDGKLSDFIGHELRLTKKEMGKTVEPEKKPEPETRPEPETKTEPTHELEILITDDQGKWAAGLAAVRLMFAEDKEFDAVILNGHGKIKAFPDRLNGVPFTLTASASGYKPKRDHVKLIRPDSLELTLIMGEGGVSREGAPLRVRDANTGAPLVGAKVELFYIETPGIKATVYQTKEDGTVEVQSPAAWSDTQEVDLRVSASAYETYKIKIKSGAPINAIYLRPLPAIPVVVTLFEKRDDSGSRSCSNIRVGLVRNEGDNPTVQATTDGRGEARLELAPTATVESYFVKFEQNGKWILPDRNKTVSRDNLYQTFDITKFRPQVVEFDVFPIYNDRLVPRGNLVSVRFLAGGTVLKDKQYRVNEKVGESVEVPVELGDKPFAVELADDAGYTLVYPEQFRFASFESFGKMIKVRGSVLLDLKARLKDSERGLIVIVEGAQNWADFKDLCRAIEPAITDAAEKSRKLFPVGLGILGKHYNLSPPPSVEAFDRAAFSDDFLSHVPDGQGMIRPTDLASLISGNKGNSGLPDALKSTPGWDVLLVVPFNQFFDQAKKPEERAAEQEDLLAALRRANMRLTLVEHGGSLPWYEELEKKSSNAGLFRHIAIKDLDKLKERLVQTVKEMADRPVSGK